MKLEEYKKKRDFTKTKEPSGESKKNNGKKLTFVVQYHEARSKHYDLRLEFGGVLLSWAVPKGLSTDPSEKRLAVMVEDHPIDYGEFEGIIPKGNYGAGTVEIFDKGYYEPLIDMKKALQKGHLKFFLHGQKLQGEWSLVKIDDKNWLAIKGEDEFVNLYDREKPIKNPFSTCSATLATLSKQIPKGRGWGFEIKYDGYRILSFVENGKARLLTRNNNDYTKRLPQIAHALEQLSAKTVVLDGEVVAFDENGRSDFGLLQEHMKNDGDIYYVIFDILALRGEDLRQENFQSRRKKLEIILGKAPRTLVLSSLVEGNGKKCFDLAKKNGLEGIIAKKLDSNYCGKRTEDWLKIKCYARQEFVIGGYTTSEKNPVLSAVLLGYFNNAKEFVFVGKVGTGFDEQLKQELVKKFKRLTTSESPFVDSLKIKNVKWIKPKLVAEIQFAELTKDRILRQPSFVGLRADKDAECVVLEGENE